MRRGLENYINDTNHGLDHLWHGWELAKMPEDVSCKDEVVSINDEESDAFPDPWK